ncbi:hypothetical protein FNQ90_23505, partial [Streptomyces alkaliphilus]|nr:hypothetical protein [Streptomyces alkaliphilus]
MAEIVVAGVTESEVGPVNIFRHPRPGGSSARPDRPDPDRRRLLGLGAAGALGLAVPPLLAGCGGPGIPRPG